MTADGEAFRADSRWYSEVYGPLSLIAVIALMVVAHLGVLRVPYFWDETYFAPAARDALLTGKLVPISVPAESHPPLLYFWLALCWKLFGFTIPVARISMLAVAAMTVAGTYRLATLLSTHAVAIAVTTLTAIYPVFFAESALVQLDMAAAGLTLLALADHLQGRYWRAGVMFTLAVLAKETAIVAPMALLAVEILAPILIRKQSVGLALRSALKIAPLFLLPFAFLLFWFAWLYHATGTILGDPGYVKYNVGGALRPMRIVLAGAQHLWHLLVYLNLYVLTAIAAVICVIRPRAQLNRGSRETNHAWLLLAGVVVSYVLMLSVVGGVVLARYLLPVYPIVMLALMVAISSRVKWWPAVAGLSALAFVAGLFPYTPRLFFRRDDNLAYLDMVALHKAAAATLPNDHKIKVLSQWPASGELSVPWLGYTKQPLDILEIDTFTAEELTAAKLNHPEYIWMFPRSACKAENPLLRARWWRTDYFRAAKELTPEEVAPLMNARVFYTSQRHCDWVTVLKVLDVDTAPQRQLPAGNPSS